MNKKNIFRYLYSLACVVLLFATISCSKWLDVRPSNQFDEEEQFETEQGYIDVLIGTYQSMAQEKTYGAELSFRFVDVLAQLYTNKSATTDYYGRTARYEFTQDIDNQHSPRKVIEGIWAGQYNSIAQLNYLLSKLDTRPAEVSEANFKLLKGEALALRAYLHFDLLRLFAPAYKDGVGSTIAIPYVTGFTVSPSQVLSFDEVVKNIERDLEASIVLQADFQGIDQIINKQGSTSSEMFTMFRQNRMNYWAAKALLARMYIYIGKKVEAKRYADEIINSERFMLFPSANRNFDERDVRSNISFTQEHIFSLYHSGLRDVADNYFKTTQLDPERSDLFNTRNVLNGIYETTVAGFGTDIRSTAGSPSRWFEHNTSTVYTKKYYSDNLLNVNHRMIPLIRLPEMYYIAAEASATFGEALEYLNKIRTARGITVNLTSQQVNSDATLANELFKEYRKEYYGEGHLWYFYKRRAYTSIPNTVFFGTMANVYTLPIPDLELEFNPDFN